MRRLLSPGLLVLHVLVLGVVVTTLFLGRWQVHRLDEVRTRNATWTANLAAPATSIAALGNGPEDEFRPVEVTGVYDPDHEILIRNRDDGGRLGWHVVTPLVGDDGTAVLVNRGWVPFELSDPPIAEAAPPPGRVTVEGYARPSQPQPRFGARDPDEGTLERVFNVDLGRLGPQFPYPLAGVWVTLERQSPATTSELPRPAGVPAFDEGPHLYYAIQWFAMAVAAVATYGAYLRRRSRESAVPAG